MKKFTLSAVLVVSLSCVLPSLSQAKEDATAKILEEIKMLREKNAEHEKKLDKILEMLSASRQEYQRQKADYQRRVEEYVKQQEKDRQQTDLYGQRMGEYDQLKKDYIKLNAEYERLLKKDAR
jgi:hypothetical protein